MKLLSRTEEMILLAAGRLGEDAYGITIRRQLEETSGKRFSVGAVYIPLERLAERGYLATHLSEPTARRGGRRRRIYRLTQKGLSALKDSKTLYDRMWAGIPDLDGLAPFRS